MMATRVLATLLIAAVLAAHIAPNHASRLLQQQPKLLGLNRSSKNLRVLAFGDSLTEGWIFTRYTKIPWTPLLQQKLASYLGSGWNVQVVNGGVGSAGVLDRLNSAWYQNLADARSQGKPYNYITFLAGINDLLLQYKSAPEILARYKEMWAAAAKDGSTVIVIPVLPANMSEERNNQRLQLNAAVKAWVKQQQAAGNWSVQVLDLEKKLDWNSMSEQQRKVQFDDGLHFTEYGYSVLGNYIAEGMRKVLKI